MQPRCPRCNYDLAGTLEQSEHCCPECGTHWTIEELTIQYEAQQYIARNPLGLGWVFMPGFLVLLIAPIGIMAGTTTFLMTLLIATCYAWYRIAQWARELHRRSFANGRTRLNRVLYVSGWTLGLVGLNAAWIAAVVGGIVFGIVRFTGRGG